MPLLGRLLLLLAACATLTCSEPPVDSRAEAERLWRAAVWEPDHHRFADAVPAIGRSLEELHRSGAPTETDLLFMLGIAYLFEGDAATGDVTLAEVRRREPGRPGALLAAGWQLSIEHRRRDSIDVLSRCLAALDGGGVPERYAEEVRVLALAIRGEDSYFHGHRQRCMNDLDEVLRMLDERGLRPMRNVTRRLAMANRVEDQARRAEEVLRAAIHRDADYAPHHFELGMMLSVQLREDEAGAAYRQALVVDPSYPLPHLKLAVIAQRVGELDTMLVHLREFERLAPARFRGSEKGRRENIMGELAAGYGSYWYEVGTARAAAGDEAGAANAYAQARRDLERAVELNFRCVRALAILVRIATLIGEPEGVIERYKRQLDAVPGAIPEAPAAAEADRTFC